MEPEPRPRLLGRRGSEPRSQGVVMNSEVITELCRQNFGTVNPGSTSKNFETVSRGLFESHEDEQSYMRRRQWFHAQVAGSPVLQREVIQMQLSPRKAKEGRLNAFGHSDDVEAYQRRREWYRQHLDGLGKEDENTQKESSPPIEKADVVIPMPAYQSDANHLPPRSWRMLAKSACIMILALSTWFSANSFLGEICDEYGISKREATLLTVCVNLGFTVSATCSALAQLPDRLSPACLLRIGCFGCAVSNALLATGLPFGALIAARFLNGMALAFVYPTLMRFTSGWFPPARRGFALGAVVGSLTVGIALPNLLKAVLPGTPWKFVTLLASLLAFLACLLTCGLQDGPYAARALTFSRDSMLAIFGNRNWWLVTMSYCGHNIELFGGWTWMGAFLQWYFEQRAGTDEGNAGDGVASVATFCIVAIGCVGATFGGLLSDFLGKRRFIVTVHLISGITLTCLPFAAHVLPPAVVLTLAGLWGLTVIADSAQYSAFLSELLVEKQMLGTAITMSLALGFTSTAVGIYVVPLLFEAAGWEGAFPCLAIGPCFGIVTILAVRPPTATPP